MIASFYGPKPNIMFAKDGRPTGGDLESLRIATDKMGALVQFKVKKFGPNGYYNYCYSAQH